MGDHDLTTPDDFEDLRLEVEILEERLDGIEAKHAVACAAEREWRAVVRARTSLIFRNKIGELARMPVKLAHLIATKGNVDCDVIEKTGTITFEHGGEVVAEVPKSLFAVLEQVLDGWAWNAGKTRS